MEGCKDDKILFVNWIYSNTNWIKCNIDVTYT